MAQMTAQKRKILFFDANNGSSGPMDKDLINAGYVPLHANSEMRALNLARRERPAAIFIYLDSCGATGLQTCRRIKSNYSNNDTVLILISSNENESAIVRGFQFGADEYLPRLHGSREVIARLAAIEKRNQMNSGRTVKIKDLEIDLYEQKVYKSGRPIRLTYIQYKLLCLLIGHHDKIFSREEILEKVWGNHNAVTNRTIDVHIKRLREKLGEVKYPSKYIDTIHGTGYQFLH